MWVFPNAAIPWLINLRSIFDFFLRKRPKLQSLHARIRLSNFHIFLISLYAHMVKFSLFLDIKDNLRRIFFTPRRPIINYFFNLTREHHFVNFLDFKKFQNSCCSGGVNIRKFSRTFLYFETCCNNCWLFNIH